MMNRSTTRTAQVSQPCPGPDQANGLVMNEYCCVPRCALSLSHIQIGAGCSGWAEEYCSVVTR